jgi:hypothetical protein
MEKSFQIAKDLKLDRLVHIKDIPEGYQYCVCPHCGDPVVASNKNQPHRRKAIYFRHKGNKTCSPDNILHSMAEDILLVERELVYPEFAENILIPKRTKDKKSYSRFLRIASGREIYQSTKKEVRYPCSVRIADVVGVLQLRKTYIEIRVHHEVDTEKEKELKALGVDSIEIDMRELLFVQELTVDLIKDYVISKAPRKWISVSRYEAQIKSIKQQLNQDRFKDLNTFRAMTEERKRSNNYLREYYSSAIDLLYLYMKPANQTKALNIFKNRLFRDHTIENNALLQIMDRFNGGVPEFLNLPVKGELAFNYHRTYWQYLIYKYLLKCVREYISWVSFTPKSLYDEINGKELLTKLSMSFEDNHGPIISEKKVEQFSYLTVKEFAALPKPIPAIRKYCNSLVELGLLTKCSGDDYQPVKEAFYSIHSR